MIRIGLRDARAHMGRFIMSIIAIMLGVSFVVGSFCFRDMLNNQVSQMMATNADADVYVRGATEQHNDKSIGTDSSSSSDSGASSSLTGNTSTTYNSINPNLAQTLSKIPGVAAASPSYMVSGLVLVGANGNAVASMGAPTLGIGVGPGNEWRSSTLTKGHWAEADNQIALTNEALDKSGLTVGDETTVVFGDGPHKVKVVGAFNTASSQAGATIIAIDPALAKSLSEQSTGKSNEVSQIGVYGSKTTPLDEQQQQQLADRINRDLPKSADAHAVTGDSVRDETTKSVQDQMGFVQPLILIFAIIALFVGSFIIANTFSMIVHDSMRGYALLRSVGASPLQIFMTVIIQALVLGLVGSVLGIALGWGMVRLIVAGLNAAGMPLTGAVNPSLTDMIVGLVVGLVVTIVGAAWPARTAALAPPIQAMNATVNPEKPVRARAIIGAVMTVLGACCWAFTWRLVNVDDPTPWKAVNDMTVGWPLGVGAALVVLGVIVMAPALVSPAQAVLGWIPSHLFPVTGRLATRNISRAKRRTANTATALFVGVAIVGCLAVVASSAKASVNSLVDTGFKGDFVAMNAANGQLTDEQVKAMEDVKGIDTAVPVSAVMGVTYNDSDPSLVMASDPSLFTKIFSPDTGDDEQQGDPVAALRDGDLVIGAQVAKNQDWKLGQTVTVRAKQVTVDEQATRQAQAQYQQHVQDQIMQVQQEAQRLAAQGDLQQAQAKAEEAQKIAEDAKHVDPMTLVKTRTDTVTKKLKIGAIITNSIYRTMAFVNNKIADELGTPQTHMTMVLYMIADKGADVASVQRKLQDAVKPYYVVNIMNRDEFKSTMATMINSILIILYALLALSIVIAIFGIVNTLALSVAERTKEIGLLRAIGTSNGQVRGMLGIEAAIISVFGTLLGIIVGVSAGMVIRSTYANNGLTQLAIPWGELGVFLVLSIVVGLVASISPAHHALKQPVLDAVASE